MRKGGESVANDGTVKIGVEFSKNDIQKGYKTIQDEAKKTANSLKSVNDALKLDPKNTDLLIEKQKLLTKAVAAAELQVSELSKELEKAKESGLEEKDAEAYRELVTALSRATVEAKQYNDELKDVNKSLDLDHGSVDTLVEKQMYFLLCGASIRDRRKICVNDKNCKYEKQRLSQEWK